MCAQYVSEFMGYFIFSLWHMSICSSINAWKFNISTKISLTPLRTGAKIVKATSQRATITSTVLLRLNTRRNAMGLLIARYLSILMAVMVNTEAATATPTNTSDYLVRRWKFRVPLSRFLNQSHPRLPNIISV